MRSIIPYNPKLLVLAKALRKQGILSEVILWNYLKNKQILGYQFVRQKPLLNYIVDFYCQELALIIEIDGQTHADKEKADQLRDNKLRANGLTILRFSDSDVKKDVDAVLRTLHYWITEHAPIGVRFD
jgi:very-short-patch-repair endonuclease